MFSIHNVNDTIIQYLLNLVKHFVSLVKKKSRPRIAPDRLSSGPTRFSRSVAMDFMSGHAQIVPIEAKRENFDAQPP